MTTLGPAPVGTAAAPPADPAAGPAQARLGYVPALDGLRGVAVLGVLAYHGAVTGAGGGFLGVDVFFALSGYLITTLLLLERDATGAIALRSFWARRARRLLPALLVVLVAVVAYAALAADPVELGRIRGDGLAALAYVSNWRFLLSGQSYFETGAAASPLRHTWSLGIEEQWYLVWPLVVALLFGVLKVRTRHAALGVLAAAGGSALLMAVLFVPGGDASRVFYGTDTRAQALLVGAGLALLLHHHGVLRLPRRVLDAVGLAALVGIVAAFALADDQATWVYRGGFLGVAVCTAVVLAVTAQPGRTLVGWLLGGPAGAAPEPLAGAAVTRHRWPLVLIGRISYGLYLWHWPIYVWLTPERTGRDGAALLAVRLAVTFAVSVASYLIVERPIRHGALGRLGQRVAPRRPWLVSVGTAAVAVAVLAGAVVVATTGAQDPATATGTRSASNAGDLRVMLVGDSVALGLGANFSRQAAGAVALDNEAIAGCGLVRAVPETTNPRVPARTEACDRRDQFWRDAVARFRPEVVAAMPGATEVFDQRVADGTVLAVGTPAYAAYLADELDHARQVLTAGGARLALVTTSCFDEPEGDAVAGPGAGVVGSERSDVARVRWLNEQWAAFAAAHPLDVRLVDLAGYTCPDYQRAGSLEGTELFSDGVHFTRPASALVWAWLGPRLGEAAR